MYEKSVMESISVHGNCGGKELKIFFCVLFVYNLIINNTLCATNKCIWCRLKCDWIRICQSNIQILKYT